MALVPPAMFRTITDILRRRAEDEPTSRVFTFLGDGDNETASLTYFQLDEAARALGARLAEAAPAGGHALLAFPPGLDFIKAFFACLYAGLVAVPVPPPA